jgi:hypothetical protein
MPKEETEKQFEIENTKQRTSGAGLCDVQCSGHCYGRVRSVAAFLQDADADL